MTSFTFQGSEAQANEWLPFAIGQQNSLLRLGIMSNVIRPNESTTIMIRTAPPHIHIIAEDSSKYYFTSRISLPDDRLYLTAEIPEEPIDNVEGKETDADIQIPAAADMDRHIWHGDGVSVVGGYGVRYLGSWFPYRSIGRFSYTDYGSSEHIQVWNGGRISYTAPFGGWCSFVLDGVVIDLQRDGQWRSSVIGSGTVADTGTLDLRVSGAFTNADFEPEVWYEPTDKPNDFKEVFKYFDLRDDFPLYTYWSVNREGTRALALINTVSDVYYERQWINDSPTHVAGDVVPGSRLSNRWMFNTVPTLIEYSIAVVRGRVVINEIDRVKYGWTDSQDSRLVFADYYYPEDGVVPHGSAVLGFISCYRESFEEVLTGADTTHTTDYVTLSIKVDGQELIRDTVRENREFSTGSSDPDKDNTDGFLTAIDLRYMSYAVWTRSRWVAGEYIGAPLYVVHNGSDVYNSIMDEGSAQNDTNNITPPPRTYVAPQGNAYMPYWDMGIRIEYPMAINYDLDSIAFYASFPSGTATSWRADLYIWWDAITDTDNPGYSIMYDMHTTLSRAIAADENGTRHCTANNWIL